MLVFESKAMDSLPSQENKIPQRVTQELLSIATGVAHYLKLLVRIGLQGSLRLERDKSTSEGLFAFLETISTANKMLDRPGLPEVYGQQGSDLCQTCGEPIDVACVRFEHREWHTQCFKCDDCETELGKEYLMAYFKDHMFSVVYCGPCNDRMFRSGKQGFMRVTLLEQYTYLLQVSLVRLAAIIDSRDGSKPISLSGEASAGEESAVALLAQDSSSRQRQIHEEQTRISDAKRSSQFQIVGLYSHNVLCGSENVLMTRSRSGTLQVKLSSESQGSLWPTFLTSRLPN
jgi:LIM domain